MTKLLSRLLRMRLSNLLMLCLPLVVVGQRTSATHDLKAEFGLDQTHDHLLKEHGYTYATAQQKFPLFVKWAETADAKHNKLAWTQDEILSAYEVDAAALQAFWSGWGYFSETPSFPCSDWRSRDNIIVPHGAFRTNCNIIYGFGHFSGQGTNCYYVSPGNVNAGSTGGTALIVDHDRWLSRVCPDKSVLMPCTWADMTGNGYMQGSVVSDLFIEGGREGMAYDPSFHSSGVVCWDMGEAGTFDHIYAFGFNDYGIELQRGTPNGVDHCSAFQCNLGGFGIIGNNGLSTSTFTACSCDDANMYVVKGTTVNEVGVGGGTIVLNGSKYEVGKRQPVRQYAFLKAEGAMNIVINGVSGDAQNGAQANFMDLDFKTYPGLVHANGVRFSGWTSTMTAKANGRDLGTFASPGNVVPNSFVITEQGLQSSIRNIGASTGGSTGSTGSTGTGTVTPAPDRASWVASATATVSGKVVNLDDGTHLPGFAIDASPASWWHSGKSQAVGDAFVVNMGKSVSFSGVTFSLPTGQYPNDKPGQFHIETSLTGANGSWTKRGNNTAGAATSTATFTKVTAQYFKIVIDVPAPGPWWAVGDLNIVP